MRIATAAAGGLASAAAVMAILAFTSGGGDGAQPQAARDGRAVWAAHGCGSCHTLAAANAVGTIGPDLAATLRGMPPAYIRKSILDPNANAAPGWSTGAMPEDYGARISPGDLDLLVAFLRASAKR